MRKVLKSILPLAVLVIPLIVLTSVALAGGKGTKPDPTPKPTDVKVETPKPTDAKDETPKPTEAKDETPKPTDPKSETPEPTEVKGPDTDGDGCPDADEKGPDQDQGGERDPLNPWDYFNPTGDGVNRTDDIGAEVVHYGHDNNGDPMYGMRYDRSMLSGGNPWQFDAPDGIIRTFDITAAVISYGDDCS